MLLGIVCLGFASCSSDKDEPTGDQLIEKLQGTWRGETIKLQAMGQTMETTFDDAIKDSQYDYFYDAVLTFSGKTVNGYDYQVKGNKVLLPWYEELGWWEEVSFTGNKMVLYMDIVQDGVPMQMWFTYIKTSSRSTVANDGNGCTVTEQVLNYHRGL